MEASYRFVALLVILFLLQQNLITVALRSSESRQYNAVGPPVSMEHRGRAPPSLPSFTINRYKKIEMDAFRPTSSGHSPGVGHFEPPTSIET